MTAHHKSLTQAVDALMMVGAGLVLALPCRACRKRSLEQTHIVLGPVERAEDPPVLAMAEMLGQVLAQRAAAGDVDQLHPPADPQHREVTLDRRVHERDLEDVALGYRVHRL